MQVPDEEPRMCDTCKERPATERYAWATSEKSITEMLCARCHDMAVAFTAIQFDPVLIDLHGREYHGEDVYDDVLARLDEILEANRHRDHDQRLVRSVALQRACALDEAGRYAEALQACEAWAEVGFNDASDRQLYRNVKAQALHGLGRSREGLALLEDALACRDPQDPRIAKWDLEKLARISEELRQPVDPKWRSLVQELYGVEVPEHEPLGKAILSLAGIVGGEDEPDDDDDDNKPSQV
jgi:tetratricopeptide (TPR) repeat protein